MDPTIDFRHPRYRDFHPEEFPEGNPTEATTTTTMAAHPGPTLSTQDPSVVADILEVERRPETPVPDDETLTTVLTARVATTVARTTATATAKPRATPPTDHSQPARQNPRASRLDVNWYVYTQPFPTLRATPIHQRRPPDYTAYPPLYIDGTSRVDRIHPPFECQFVTPGQRVTRGRGPQTPIENRLEERILDFRDMHYDPVKDSITVMHAFFAIADILAELALNKMHFLVQDRCYYLRTIALSQEAYVRLCHGFNYLAIEIRDERPAQARFQSRICDNSVLVWLAHMAFDFLLARPANLFECASRWMDNVHLWCIRNYSGLANSEYLGAAGQHALATRPADVQPTVHHGADEVHLPLPLGVMARVNLVETRMETIDVDMMELENDDAENYEHRPRERQEYGQPELARRRDQARRLGYDGGRDQARRPGHDERRDHLRDAIRPRLPAPRRDSGDSGEQERPSTRYADWDLRSRDQGIHGSSRRSHGEDDYYDGYR